MNRRAFLTGSAALAVAGPMVAKAAASDSVLAVLAKGEMVITPGIHPPGTTILISSDDGVTWRKLADMVADPYQLPVGRLPSCVFTNDGKWYAEILAPESQGEFLSCQHTVADSLPDLLDS